MAENNVIITFDLNPSQITINVDDTIVWINSSTQIQTVSSDDGGQTFTTGTIEVNSQSLPIVFSEPSSGISYTCTSGLHGAVIVQGQLDAAIGFEAKIKPYFTELDRNSMMDAVHTFGIIVFDLWSASDCRANWDAIKDAIANGSMPPAGAGSDGPWPQPKIDHFVQDFTAWKNGGFQP
jgi:hypothetical protein